MKKSKMKNSDLLLGGAVGFTVAMWLFWILERL